jgi:hypothetical protein
VVFWWIGTLPLFTYRYSLYCRESKFSQIPIQLRATLSNRTGAKCPFAPVLTHPRSRHLDIPPHKNSLAVSENASSRKVSE